MKIIEKIKSEMFQIKCIFKAELVMACSGDCLYLMENKRVWFIESYGFMNEVQYRLYCMEVEK